MNRKQEPRRQPGRGTERSNNTKIVSLPVPDVNTQIPMMDFHGRIQRLEQLALYLLSREGNHDY